MAATATSTPQCSVVVEVSFGELVDKITILEIKSERISDERKQSNVRSELTALDQALRDSGPHPTGLEALKAELKAINETLWKIEDDIRDCERAEDFGERFIGLARSVYVTNDERAALKRRLNTLVGSRLVEEKSYAPYVAAS